MVDKNEFFREVTQRLCSHLEIEHSLQACVGYLSEHMPADALYLERYEKELAAMRVVARGTPDLAEKLDVLVALPEAAMAAMARVTDAYNSGILFKSEGKHKNAPRAQ